MTNAEVWRWPPDTAIVDAAVAFVMANRAYRQAARDSIHNADYAVKERAEQTLMLAVKDSGR